MRISGYYGRVGAGELKFHDFNLVDTTIGAGGTMIATSAVVIAQGTTEIERIGRKCLIKSLEWRFELTKFAATSNVGDDAVRLIVFLDKQCNGAVPAITDILETADYQSFYNLANQSRFRIMMDKTYSMNAHAGGSATVAMTYNKTGRFYKRMNIPIEYNGVTGALTEIRSNNIVIFAISKLSTCSLLSKVRVRYTG